MVGGLQLIKLNFASGFAGLMLAAALGLGEASAVTVSADADVATPGVQSSLAVSTSDSFDVSLVFSNIGSPVAAMAVTLAFDPSILQFTGSSLNPSFLGVSNTGNNATGNYTGEQITFVPVNSGTITFGTISFTAIADGVSDITFGNVNIPAGPATRIGGPGGLFTIDTVQSATITVGDQSGVVPLPAPALLLLSGLAGLALIGRRGA